MMRLSFTASALWWASSAAVAQYAAGLGGAEADIRGPVYGAQIPLYRLIVRGAGPGDADLKGVKFKITTFPWLTVVPSTGVTPQEIQISVNQNEIYQFTPGIWRASVVVTTVGQTPEKSDFGIVILTLDPPVASVACCRR